MINPLIEVLPHIREGKIRPLGATTRQRHPLLPDIPSIGEILPGFEVISWQGLFAPAGLPEPALRRWDAAANDVLRDPAIIAWVAENAAEPAGGPPEEFAALLASERARRAAAGRATRLALG